ncbi:MAG: putative transporter, substrate-binding protein [Peptococcaceae bacterium]|nr:putative transporter, substrate-binding protein [Peptococcaceae bacterium]
MSVKLRKDLVVLTILMLVAGLVLGGCGQKKPEAPKEPEKTVIRFAHWRGEDKAAFDAIIKKFEAENPTIKVEQSIEGSEKHDTKILAEFQAKNGPDVFAVMPGARFANVVKGGWFLDISGEKFLEVVKPHLRLPGQDGGKQYAVPYQLVLNDPVYNKAIFEKYKLEPPKDWKGFLALCETLKKNGVTPIIFDSEIGPGQFMNPMLMNNMPSDDALVKVQKGELKLTEDWFVTTLKQFKELNDKGYFQKDVLGTKKAGAAALFAQEKGAMLAQGSYMMASNKQANPNLKQGLLAPITVSADKMKYEGIHTATFMIAVNKDSKNVEAAKKFMAFLFKPEIAAEYANATGQMLTISGVQYKTEELMEQAKWLEKKTLFQPRYMITVSEVEKAIVNSIMDVIGGMAPEKAALKAQQEVDRVIKK